MSVGLPCVGLKTAPGVNELIVDSKNGFLAENNVADFAAKLKLLMDNPSLRATLGQNGRTFVKQFEPQKIWDQWENLITETVGQYKKRNAA
jgi:glycosyltransferase involved in cell wall biosynthesis